MEIVFWYVVIGVVISTINYIDKYHPLFNAIGMPHLLCGIVLWPLIIVNFIADNWKKKK